MKPILILLLTALISGCCAIGVETVSPSFRSVSYVKLNDHHFSSYDRNTKEELIKSLGEPVAQTSEVLRYKAQPMKWSGVAIDCAIFPIPLTVPLMVPTGRCFVDFNFKDGRVQSITVQKMSSKFYGFGSGDNEAGWFWGNQSGFWFNPN